MKDWLERRLKNSWAYWVAGIVLGSMNVILLCYSGQAMKVSGGIAYSIGKLANLIGIDSKEWLYFRTKYAETTQDINLIDNSYTFLTIGLVVGAMVATLATSQWRIRRFKKDNIRYALVGGILMGFGARLAGGCNLGALFSAIPSFSLHGWVFWFCLFIGCYIGNKILIKYRL